jgi:hypothetical protein
MPEISRFFGIIIRMYPDDHNPPHFHARYAGREIEVSIRTLEILKGRLPVRAVYSVMEWAEMHQGELTENWRLLMAGKEPQKITPLE